jgi:diaminohydroxyphosphoribosylaminopyrimidine deaminase / 5-amino-6-(5-phosphoribosylamino)uracil reductase
MKRAVELAQLGLGSVAPNPLVGCVIVHQDKIIGEGYHKLYGQAHAEVNAINSVADQELLKESTLYVTLEPCSHHGKTPPCSDLIISKQIPRVVIGNVDPFEQVNGRGIARLRNAGIAVDTGVLEKECSELNKRFFTFHVKKRPYIFLKWAESNDGYIDKNGKPTKISCELSSTWVHQLRSQEQAILVGGKTLINDNPMLTTRKVAGKSPIRLILDTKGNLPGNLKVFNSETKTVVFTPKKQNLPTQVEQVIIEEKGTIKTLISYCLEKQIQSLIIEGGSKTLQLFIENNLWDEAFCIKSNELILDFGTVAPKLSHYTCVDSIKFDRDTISHYRNTTTPIA